MTNIPCSPLILLTRTILQGLPGVSNHLDLTTNLFCDLEHYRSDAV